VTTRVSFAPRPGEAAGDVELFYGDVPVGAGVVPCTTPLTYGTAGFAVGWQPAGPIVPELTGRAELCSGVLGRVTIDVGGRGPAAGDSGARERVDLATQ
jgi:hypothetical protein